MRSWPRTALAAGLVLALAGCEGKRLYPVEGVLQYDDGSPAKALAGGTVSLESVADKSNASGATGHASGESDETADHAWYDDAHESLANPSGNAPEHFVPEQGSKGAREQGSKVGVGGPGLRVVGPPSPPPAQRPAGRPPLHEIPDDFAITDAERRWCHSNYPDLDPDFETEQFIRYWRSEGRRKRNWHDAWQKWVADSAKKARDRQQRNGAAGGSRSGTGSRAETHTADDYTNSSVEDLFAS